MVIQTYMLSRTEKLRAFFCLFVLTLSSSFSKRLLANGFLGCRGLKYVNLMQIWWFDISTYCLKTLRLLKRKYCICCGVFSWGTEKIIGDECFTIRLKEWTGRIYIWSIERGSPPNHIIRPHINFGCSHRATFWSGWFPEECLPKQDAQLCFSGFTELCSDVGNLVYITEFMYTRRNVRSWQSCKCTFSALSVMSWTDSQRKLQSDEIKLSALRGNMLYVLVNSIWKRVKRLKPVLKGIAEA